MPRGEDCAQVLLELLGEVQRLTVNNDLLRGYSTIQCWRSSSIQLARDQTPPADDFVHTQRHTLISAAAVRFVDQRLAFMC